jgi:hypothetical protein
MNEKQLLAYYLYIIKQENCVLHITDGFFLC